MSDTNTQNSNPPTSAEGQGQAADQTALAQDDLFAIPLDWQRWWTIIPEIVSIVCAATLPILTGLNIVSRYTDWYRVPWVEDIVKILFLWIVFLGGAIAVKYEAHVRMGTFADKYAGAGLIGNVWRWAIRLSPIAMGTILLVFGMQIVEIHMKRELTWLEIPSGYFSTVIPLSGALMIIYNLGSLRRTAPAKAPEPR